MRPSLTLLAAVSSLIIAGPAIAETREAPIAPPRLVVAISVDQLAADLFAQYRQHFTAGLGRLLTGAVFPSAFQSHAATETCPGHSTLLTGARPARTGIIANTWFVPGIARADKRVYCSEDETDPASTSRDSVVSARQLKVPTLGERLKAANRKSLNVAVSAKDRAVMMMGGHAIDAGYWWKGGAFATLAGRPLSPAARAANRASAEVIAAGAPELPLPAWCAARDEAVPVGDGMIGTGRFALPAGQADAFRVSPRMDAATVDLAVALVDEMKLGADAAPDVLSVSLSATDYIGHAAGHEGAEMCIQMAQLDASIGRLLDALDARGLDYVVALSADHGGVDAVERLGRQGYPEAARIDGSLTADALAAAVTAATGITVADGPLVYNAFPGGDYWLSAALAPQDKARAVAALAATARANPQVAAVFTAAEIAAAPAPAGSPQDWSLLDRAKASFDPQRSGDVVVLLKRGVSPIRKPGPGYSATHGSPWDYDRRVPLLFWRKGLAGFEQPAPVETVDIAPTLAALLELDVPAGAFDGRCLDIDGGAGDTCAPPPRKTAR